MNERRRIAALALSILALLAACRQEPAPAASIEPDPPSILPRPYTAEQIRDEWIEGFTVTVRRASPSGEAVERWRVAGWDEEGMDLESTVLDEEGEPMGEPTVERNGWVEVRDHASFPAASTTREEVTIETPLGTLDCWLYTVTDETSGTVSQFHFAKDLPGAPVRMRVLAGEEAILELEQIARYRPR